MQEIDKNKIERRDYELSRKEEMPQKPGYTTPDPAKPQSADSRDPTAYRDHDNAAEFSTGGSNDFSFHHDSSAKSRADIKRTRDD